jgi:hypothetical protein
MNMPVIVPVRAVMAEKISLFHARSIAKWAISSVVRLSVMVIASFTPVTSLLSGGIVVVFVCCWMRFVRAFLIQSVVVGHLLLFYTTV